jgi:DNA-binding GntR family transcriptional regulator
VSRLDSYTGIIDDNERKPLFVEIIEDIEKLFMDKPLKTTESQRENGAGETLASLVYDRLLKDILKGNLEPGLKLRLQVLKQDYDVGNSPLREALNRLSENGMVIREENKGFRVAPTSVEELEELIRTRCWLEEIALRESIKNGDDHWEERVVLAFHRLSRVSAASNATEIYTTRDWEQRHREYHLAVLSACNSNILLGYCKQLHEKTLRYRNLAAVVEYRERHELEEHRALQDAVLDRNADLAVELLNKHFKVTADIVISSGSIS